MIFVAFVLPISVIVEGARRARNKFKRSFLATIPTDGDIVGPYNVRQYEEVEVMTHRTEKIILYSYLIWVATRFILPACSAVIAYYPGEELVHRDALDVPKYCMDCKKSGAPQPHRIVTYCYCREYLSTVSPIRSSM